MKVVHLVRSNAFAGVERYVATTASAMASSAEVTVVGGDPATMPVVMSGVRWMSGSTRFDAARSLRRIGPVDVINSHMTDSDLIAAMYAPRVAALVSTRHFAAPRGASLPARAAGELAGRRFRAQLSISQYVADHIGSASTVVHTGIRSAEDRLSEPEPIVLVVQRLEPEKATDVAVRAWAASTGPERGWRFVVLGDGSQRERLERLAVELDVADSIEFRGFVDPSKWYARAAILLAPTPREGLGISVLEAMAYEVAIVAADGGGHRETIGGTGDPCLFPPGDADAAARRLDALIGDPVARAATARAGRDRQRTEFTIDRQVRATLGLYQSVLG